MYQWIGWARSTAVGHGLADNADKDPGCSHISDQPIQRVQGFPGDFEQQPLLRSLRPPRVAQYQKRGDRIRQCGRSPPCRVYILPGISGSTGSGHQCPTWSGGTTNSVVPVLQGCQRLRLSAPPGRHPIPTMAMGSFFAFVRLELACSSSIFSRALLMSPVDLAFPLVVMNAHRLHRTRRERHSFCIPVPVGLLFTPAACAVFRPGGLPTLLGTVDPKQPSCHSVRIRLAWVLLRSESQTQHRE